MLARGADVAEWEYERARGLVEAALCGSAGDDEEIELMRRTIEVLLRAGAPLATDPLVFRRDAEEGTDSREAPLSRLLASLGVDERSLNRRSE